MRLDCYVDSWRICRSKVRGGGCREALAAGLVPGRPDEGIWAYVPPPGWRPAAQTGRLGLRVRGRGGIVMLILADMPIEGPRLKPPFGWRLYGTAEGVP